MGLGADLGDDEAVLTSQGENSSELAFEGAHLVDRDTREKLMKILEDKVS